ncbi:MAG TPA: dipeptide ABC transporter ATP-binding protein [Burkholderiaceae bacterium]|nr:dipeptide ABC transporter ATP-binding protein [Burkholderiaceae bacterium]
MTDQPVLSIESLSVAIASEQGVVEAVKALSLSIQRGQTFALVGESGCGKSMTALALLRLLPDAGWMDDGTVTLGETVLTNLTERAMRDVRGGQVGIVFQEPATSLNPVLSVGRQIVEVLQRHTRLRGRALRDRAIEWLDRVGIPEAAQRFHDYPFQFSGGQKQRIMIAIALAAEPRLLVADEPTTALDVTVQAQILQLLADMQQELGLAILLITHDLAVVRQVADQVALMRTGEILVTQPADEFFDRPGHAYARELLAAVPTLAKRGQPLAVASVSAEPDQAVASQDRPASRTNQPVLEVNKLSVSYVRKRGILPGSVQLTPVVRDVSFTLHEGETVALLGESGCGKTTIAKTLLRLIDRDTRRGGTVRLGETDVLTARGKALRELRQRMQIVFQDPYGSLDPRMPVGDILEEGLMALRPGQSAADRHRIIQRLLDRVGLPSSTRTRYPHEFSGGQRQRIAIARALALEPDVLVCDEPTSALDVSVQAQLLDLLQELQREFNMAYLFITHNFGVVEYLADRIVIMDQGRIIEDGAAVELLRSPTHPKARQLLDAVPRL